MTRVAVLDDTHLPRRARDIPPSAWSVIDSADLVIHTGDVSDGDDDGGLFLLNPGSPTDRRRMPTFTMAVMILSNGTVAAEIVDLGLERVG